MNVYNFLAELTGLSKQQTWIFEVFTVVFAVVLVNFILRRFFDRLAKRAEKSENVWDDAFIGAIRKPTRGMVWVIGLTFAAEIAFASNSSTEGAAVAMGYLDSIREVGVIIIIFWFLLRVVGQLEHTFKTYDVNRNKDPVDAATVEAIGRLFSVSLYITGALVVLQTLGFSISGILAFGGVGGIAVGFAAKDLLSNFFGGLTIYIDRPFAVGDWIRSPDRTIEGTVENIGWRRTVIRKFDKRPLYVPNATFLSIAVENPSRMTNRRINETIGIRYADAGVMEEVVDEVKYYLKNHSEIDQDQTMIVNFNAFGDSSLDFFIYTFTKTVNWVKYHEIKQEVMLDIYDIIRKAGADCAFPTTTIDFADETLSVATGRELPERPAPEKVRRKQRDAGAADEPTNGDGA